MEAMSKFDLAVLRCFREDFCKNVLPKLLEEAKSSGKIDPSYGFVYTTIDDIYSYYVDDTDEDRDFRDDIYNDFMKRNSNDIHHVIRSYREEVKSALPRLIDSYTSNHANENTKGVLLAGILGELDEEVCSLIDLMVRDSVNKCIYSEIWYPFDTLTTGKVSPFYTQNPSKGILLDTRGQINKSLLILETEEGEYHTFNQDLKLDEEGVNSLINRVLGKDTPSKKSESLSRHQRRIRY